MPLDPPSSLSHVFERQTLGGSVTAADVEYCLGQIADALVTTKAEVAMSAGLSCDQRSKIDPTIGSNTHDRLREMVQILARVEPRLGSAIMAYAWYRSEPLTGFAGLTAMQLLKLGRATVS